MHRNNILSFAIETATKAHKNQTREDSDIPYIVHPLQVMTILYEYGITNERVLAAAVLHDTVEDTDMSILDIQVIFGRDVARIVGALTKPTGDYRSEAESIKIKKATRLSNISTPFPEDWSVSKCYRYLQEGVVIANEGYSDALSLQLENRCKDLMSEIEKR